MFALANALSALGRHEEELALREKVLDGYKKILDLEDLEALKAKQDLADKDPDVIKSLDLTSIIGDTSMAMDALARTLSTLERYDEALALVCRYAEHSRTSRRGIGVTGASFIGTPGTCGYGTC